MTPLPRTVLGTARMHYRRWHSLARSLPLATRLFCYSVCFEAFLFFLLFDRLTAGFSLTLARAFQVALYGLLLVRGVRVSLPEPNRRFPHYLANFTLFLAACAVVFGLTYAGGSNYILQAGTPLESDASNAFAQAFAAPATRPLIEAFVLLLTLFHYFWLGPRMVGTRQALIFLVLTFLLLCYVSLAVGFLNLGYAAVAGNNLIPRHFSEFLYDAPSYSGIRFQGLAGEPRDAFGQLVLFLVVLVGARRMELVRLSDTALRRLVVLGGIAMLATLSASGVAAVGLFVALYAAVQLFRGGLSLRKLVQVLAIALVMAGVLYAMAVFVERFGLYIEAFGELRRDEELSPRVLTQFNNIQPVLHWLDMCVAGRIDLCAFGGGFGTSFALNIPFYTEGLVNPHAYVSRIVPELGFVGAIVFLVLLMRPVFRKVDAAALAAGGRAATLRVINTWLLAVLAVTLAHKSNHVFFALLVVCLGAMSYVQLPRNGASTDGR